MTKKKILQKQMNFMIKLFKKQKMKKNVMKSI